MPPKIHILPDTHWRHAHLVENGSRPEDFTNTIIENWDKLVGEDDTVIHLGDVLFGDHKEILRDILDARPGYKILVRGNHDSKTPEWYLDHGFCLVTDGILLNSVFFSHEPVHPLPPWIKYNIHGHLHKDNHREMPSWYHESRWRYILAEVETTLGPLELNEFIETHNMIIDINKRRPYDYQVSV